MENQPEPNGQNSDMGMLAKVIIIVVLIIAVAAVFYMKSGSSNDETGTAQANIAAENETMKVEKKAPVKKALPQLVDLGADKCIPCKMMKPILDELKVNYKDEFGVTFIDVWKDSDAGQKYNIRVIPTQIFFDASGKELFRHEGFFSKEDIMGKWADFGYTFDNDGKE
jgi:thioredoxin